MYIYIDIREKKRVKETWGDSMLETPIERVKLLKAGISGKKIEELYIVYNNFKILGSPVVLEQIGIINCEINCQHGEIAKGFFESFPNPIKSFS